MAGRATTIQVPKKSVSTAEGQAIMYQRRLAIIDSCLCKIERSGSGFSSASV